MRARNGPRNQRLQSTVPAKTVLKGRKLSIFEVYRQQTFHLTVPSSRKRLEHHVTTYIFSYRTQNVWLTMWDCNHLRGGCSRKIKTVLLVQNPFCHPILATSYRLLQHHIWAAVVQRAVYAIWRHRTSNGFTPPYPQAHSAPLQTGPGWVPGWVKTDIMALLGDPVRRWGRGGGRFCPLPDFFR